MEAVILIGAQGAGKSMFFAQRLCDTHVRINLDMLRTRRREALLLEACLAGGQPFAIDKTNPTVEVRRPYIEAARARGFRVVGYFFRCTLKECLARNARRDGGRVIPPAGVRATYSRMQPPTMSEGFDELHEVRIVTDGQLVVQPM